ncbi:translation termination factor GTPase eRF3 [Lithohypha guttulata]|uniref:translation termination factor GTPase eRF3 n=1 Tax=Lithohypha guttulata TaxID=1690604 RepID=UPI002DDF32EB|nr:translation termination factor GTPase eRF3 [Lithohypha guttulata]KAK5103298.1 translation termination factor GTPase eRF3 [Lithohypha guttulata]
MSGNYDSWEDAAAQDEELNRQTQNMNIGANTFRPGASSFQPGASNFTPGQQYQQYNGYQQQYAGYGQQPQQGYGQYQQYPQQGFNQYQQYQQQQPRQNNNAQFAAFNQAPGQFQPKQGAPISIAKRGAADSSATPTSTAAKSAAAPAPAAKPDTAAPPKAKVLSIGVPAPLKAAEKKVDSPTAKTAPSEDKAADAAQTPAETGAKVAAAKAVEKTGDKISGKTTPPSKTSGKASPTPAETKKKVDADAIAQAQTADVDSSVLEEMYGKEHVNIIFIGHVDAGKSTLGGQVLIQTGMVDERTLDKYKREAKDAGRETWYISWVMDLNTEERAKGKTIEVGRGFFETEKRRYTILDAPGHKTYVPNMLSGAAQADVAILVISARKGEFETGFEKGGQTQEHAMLIKTTGAKEVVVAVNKMDDVTVEWAEERYKEIETKLKPFLKKKMGLDSTFLPISAQTGIGVKERIPKDVAPWHEGPSLLEFLDNMKKIARNLNAPFMMPVGAKYRDLGTMIEGRIEAGVVQKTSSLTMMPNREQISISALYGETEEEIPHATCGEQVRMRIRGIEEEDIMPGFVLCSPKRLVHCVSAFEAQINIVELRSILSAGFNCVVHVHAATEEVTFEALLHKLEPKTGRKSKKPPPFASKGMAIIARMRVTSGGGKICVERFEDYPQLGRFTLRDQGQTIAVGKITKLLLDEE